MESTAAVDAPVFKCPLEVSVELNKLLAVYKKWLYFHEDYAIVGPICAVIANFDPGDPDIWGVIGPSGSLKTEVLRSFG